MTGTILTSSQNLADVTDVPAARVNLGVYSTAEVFTKDEVIALIAAIPPATPGSRWLSGSGVPATGLGNVSDFYFDTDTGDVYEKTGATTWILSSNIKGDSGRDGVKGTDGTAGQDGENGTHGTNGTNGTPGTNGTDGLDGVSFEDNETEIINIIQTSNVFKTALEVQEDAVRVGTAESNINVLTSGFDSAEAVNSTITQSWYALTDENGSVAQLATTLQAADAATLASANDYTRASVGYCEVGGNPTAETDLAACELAGGTWVIGAPFAANLNEVSVTTGNGSAKISDVMLTYQDVGGNLVARNSVLTDNNGNISGFTASNDGTVSDFNVIADKFAVGTWDAAANGGAGALEPSIYLDSTDPQNPVMTLKGRLVLTDGSPISTAADLDGTDGATWFYVTGTPSSGTGKVGDFALSNGRYVYEKTGETTWTYRSDLHGDQGPQGFKGDVGDDGNPGPGWFALQADATANGRVRQIGDVSISGGNPVRWNGSSWTGISAFIDGAMVVTGGITTTQLAANTITAGDIASNTITANEIAANTITANEIAVGTITADEIAAGTITADEIAANTITATKIDTSDLFAANINATGSITYGTINTEEYISLSGAGASFGKVTADNVRTTTLNIGTQGSWDAASGIYLTVGDITISNSSYAVSSPNFTFNGPTITVPGYSASSDLETILNNLKNYAQSIKNLLTAHADDPDAHTL